MVLRSVTSSVRSAVSFSARLRNSGTTDAEQHRGAQRLQRIFRPHQERRRRAPSGALQRCQHLDDLGAARIERVANLLLAAIERTQPRFGVVDPRLDAAHLGCDVDQLLVELAAVLADRGDIGFQFLLKLGCFFLLLAGGLEFLLALLDGVGRRGRRRLLLRGGHLRDRRRKRCRGKAGGKQHTPGASAADGAGVRSKVPR